MSKADHPAIVFEAIPHGWRSRALIAKGTWPDTCGAMFPLVLEKWRTIVVLLKSGIWPLDDGGRRTCGFCHLFYDDACCMGCPVGHPACTGTPYHSYYKALERNDRAAALDAAERELAFLEGLPCGEKA